MTAIRQIKIGNQILDIDPKSTNDSKSLKERISILEEELEQLKNELDNYNEVDPNQNENSSN